MAKHPNQATLPLGEMPIVQYGDDNIPVENIIVNATPPCDMPMEDMTAGSHGPQHKHVGDTPRAELSALPKYSKPAKGDPHAGMGSF